MSTRGILGFVVDGQVKITYSPYDSYPSGLGAEVLSFVRRIVEEGNLPLWRKLANDLVLHDGEQKVESHDLELARQIVELDNETRRKTLVRGTFVVTTESPWEEVLTTLNGNPEKILTMGHVVEEPYFAADSLFCEWGYVINFDESTIEVYKGFQSSPGTGRFYPVDGPISGYWPISLVATHHFDALPEEIYPEDEE